MLIFVLATMCLVSMVADGCVHICYTPEFKRKCCNKGCPNSFGKNTMENLKLCIRGIFQTMFEENPKIPPACCELPLFELICKIFNKTQIGYDADY